MIPRLKPYLGKEELLAALRRQEDAVVRFEEAFARTFEARYAVAFPYGRSGLWALFKTLGIERAEIIMPAYTCVVVAHATVLSNNIPRFVDITLYDYNVDLDQMEAAINERTRAVIATHLFGYPLDVDRLVEIVRAAEARLGHKIWVVQDCAHAFGARWQGKLVCNEGDAALFGLGISKMITSVLGGMITTNDPELYGKLRAFRDRHFVHPGLPKLIRRFLYLLAVYPAFNERIYGLVNWLEEETPLLDWLTKAYHLDENIHFPPDYLDQMLDVEARVGLVQLPKYPEIVRRRRENAGYYNQHLQDSSEWLLPPMIDGATYSHYVLRVQDRRPWLAVMRKVGVQLGELIQYSIPEMPAYRKYVDGDFPNARQAMSTTLNLPVHAHLKQEQIERIVRTLEMESERQTRIERQVLRANVEYHDLVVEDYEQDVGGTLVFNPKTQQQIDAIVSMLRERTEGQLWVDVGCGTGNVLKYARKHFAQAVGFDVSVGMLRRAQERGCEVSLGNARGLPVSSGSADVVSAYSVLHHLFDPVEAIREAYRVLRPGGYFYSEFDPNGLCLVYHPISRSIYRPIYRLYQRLIHRDSLKEVDQDDEVAHLQRMAEYHHHYTQGLDPRQLTLSMRQIGFSEVRIYPSFGTLNEERTRRYQGTTSTMSLAVNPFFSVIARK